MRLYIQFSLLMTCTIRVHSQQDQELIMKLYSDYPDPADIILFLHCMGATAEQKGIVTERNAFPACATAHVLNDG